MGALLADGSAILAHVDLVAQDHEGEGVRVARAGLDEELVAPRVEGFEGFGAVDVVDEDAAVGAPVEGYAEGLKAFLSCGVPELERDDAVVDGHFFRQEVGADGGFVGGGELLVDLL